MAKPELGSQFYYCDCKSWVSCGEDWSPLEAVEENLVPHLCLLVIATLGIPCSMCNNTSLESVPIFTWSSSLYTPVS